MIIFAKKLSLILLISTVTLNGVLLMMLVNLHLTLPIIPVRTFGDIETVYDEKMLSNMADELAKASLDQGDPGRQQIESVMQWVMNRVYRIES